MLQDTFSSILTPSTLLLSTCILYILYQIAYNLILHPLRKYPGPLLWRICRFPLDYHKYNGTTDRRVLELHQTYGATVRVAPNELSFTSSQAIRDIYAHAQKKEEFRKDPLNQQLPPNGIPNILGASKENHARYRRLLAHAFSEKGLREQAPLIMKYVDLLVDCLREKAQTGETIDIAMWYNMLSFDIIGDLAFGEPFDSLANRKEHDWIPAISGSAKFVQIFAVLRQYGLEFLSSWFVPSKTKKLRAKHLKLTEDKVNRRMEVKEERGDFWDRILIKSANDNESGEGMTREEMFNNASSLVLAGSVTSSLTLAGATYLLQTHPSALQALTNEIRSTFASSNEITITSTAHLPYLLAVLEETMRLYPAVAKPGPRLVPRGGAVVCGDYLPENTVVSYDIISTHRSPHNFHRPNSLLPERWLQQGHPSAHPNSTSNCSNPDFSADDKSAFKPFALGTRDCIGKNLAYAELRLVLAKVIWHFDLSLDERATGNWFDQRTWGIRFKNPLWVIVHEAQE